MPVDSCTCKSNYYGSSCNLVIAESKNNDTFIQNIDFLWDDSEALYQGEAFIKDIKYSFEIKAKSGTFIKWDISRGDETWEEKYYNVGENLGYEVEWNPLTKTVIIK